MTRTHILVQLASLWQSMSHILCIQLNGLECIANVLGNVSQYHSIHAGLTQMLPCILLCKNVHSRRSRDCILYIVRIG